VTGRVDLGVWRTPLEPAPRLAERIGLGAGDLWVKRDDWLGFGGGGNKVRKLELLCAAAIEQGATTLVTSGAAQSNYARLTAAAARRLGLGVVLVLVPEGEGAGEGEGTGAGTGARTGNLALDGLFGAEIRWAEWARLDEVAAAVVEELRARGERPALLPYGGSNATGARGYLACAEELAEQAPDARHVVVAVGSGGTMAGLVAGLGAERVLGVNAGAVPDAAVRVAAMVSELAEASGSSRPVGRTELRLCDEQIGGGYEQLTDSARQAMREAGRHEGLILDPVYTGKAMAGLVAAVETGEIGRGQRTVFVHTGGLPGLFGHPFASELAAGARAGSG
jgi:D-cysteine desulfhydrase